MAQARHPQQQQPPPPFSTQSFSPPVSSPSPNSAASPVNGAVAPPPSKRPRLSPLPPSQTQSPYGSPSFGAMQLPPNHAQMNGAPVNMNMNVNMTSPAPPPPAPPGTMGPPSRPVDKTTDAAELTDVLASSGIDVREEEAFLTRSFSGQNAQAQPPQRGLQMSHPPPINTSFNSQVSTPGTLSASNSFGELPQIKPAIANDSFTSDPSSQAPAPFKDPNEPTREDTVAARRAQYHIQEPFLLTKLLEQKLQKRGFDLGVRIPAEGLFHPVPGRPQPIEVTGPDGSSVVRTGQTILNQDGAPLVDILNILSISCEERLRGVIDYSSSLARSRRAHSHGTVPAEWRDIASPLGPTAGNVQTPVKRPHSAVDSSGPKPNPERFRALIQREALQEERRAAKRAKRNSNAILGEAGRAESVDINGSAPSTPIGDKTPSFDKKSVTKKEARKMVDSKASEAQQHQQSVETARMALSGRMFGAKKSYSWLKSGGPANSGFSSPSRPAPSTPTAGPEKSISGESAPSQTHRRLGTWREDQERGAGIQVRDVLFMLEADGRGTKHIQKGYLKDPKEDRDRGN
ncbi:uncharacterized protein N7511_008583 [Penicillium nucicola]|uniref:uncharacterized protein n=1 Tax=Penicillium nucicola TaxID=1850975 RepID=UPI002545022D|nr:uncharacterized protein N7511_008583 [Penicillium nucicola]KAJ5746887.1 hypothetical protein N7511_008583 [Penicillium nucicola]